MFMGAMMLIVLPLFLVICIRMIRQSSFGKRPVGVILEGIFLLSIALSVTGLLYLATEIIKDM